VTAWVKLKSGTEKDVSLRMNGEALASAAANANVWTKVEGLYTSNSGSGQTVSLAVNGLNANDVYYVDDFTMVEYNPGADELLRVIREAEKILEGINASGKLGEYSADAKQDTENAIEEARRIVNLPSPTIEQTTAAAMAIENALAEISNKIVREVTLSQGEAVTVPEGLTDAVIRVPDGVSGNSITLPSESAGIKIIVMGTAKGKALETIQEIPAGTKISGSRVINPQSIAGTASITLPGTVDFAVKLNHSGTNFDLPVKLSVTGQGSGIYYINASQAMALRYASRNDQQSANGDLTSQAAVKYTEDTGVCVWTKQPLELVWGTNLETVTDPSPSPSDNGGNGGNGGNSGNGGNGGIIVIPGQPTPSPKKGFEDIEGHWAKADIEELAGRGIITGVTETTFEPDRSITRAEFTTLIAKAFKLQASGENSYSDVAEEAWYAPYVMAASEAGIVTGYEGAFRPQDLVTREEMAMMMSRAYTMKQLDVPVLSGLDRFRDKNEISAWARTAVDFTVSTGMMNGMDDGRFAPKENTTRAQTAVVLKRFLDIAK